MMKGKKRPIIEIPISVPEEPQTDNFGNSQNSVSDNPLEEFPEINKDDLERMGELGHGNGGVVWKVKHKTLNKIMAQKIIHLEVKPHVRNQILKELRVLQRCKSPHIVGFYGTFCAESDISICMEFMDGLSLDILVKKVGRIPEPVLGKISVAVLNGLNYLKSELGILHRDVKPSNILVNTKGDIKLCDFGVSGQLINSISNSMGNSFVGTRTYMAPERLSGSEYSIKSDVWSFGVSIVELAIGKYPVPSPTAVELAEMFNKRLDELILTEEQKKNMLASNAERLSLMSIQDNNPSAQSMAIFELLNYIVDGPPPTLPRGIFSDEFTEMMEICLKKDPISRADVKTLLKHPFIVRSSQSDLDFADWVTKSFKISDLTI